MHRARYREGEGRGLAPVLACCSSKTRAPETPTHRRVRAPLPRARPSAAFRRRCTCATANTHTMPTHIHTTLQVSYYYDSDVGDYYYGMSHPMKPHRVRMCHDLIVRYGLYRQLQVRSIGVNGQRGVV